MSQYIHEQPDWPEFLWDSTLLLPRLAALRYRQGKLMGRKDYYAILERTQKGALDVTPWIEWFLGCLDRAFDGAESLLEAVLKKGRFWRFHANESFNDRQRALLNRLLDGFTGKLTTSKWAKIARCSQDTAYRDIFDLLQRGVLAKAPEGGRSTSYLLSDTFVEP